MRYTFTLNSVISLKSGSSSVASTRTSMLSLSPILLPSFLFVFPFLGIREIRNWWRKIFEKFECVSVNRRICILPDCLIHPHQDDGNPWCRDDGDKGVLGGEPDQHRQLDLQVVLQSHDDLAPRLLGHRQQQTVLRRSDQLWSRKLSTVVWDWCPIQCFKICLTRSINKLLCVSKEFFWDPSNCEVVSCTKMHIGTCLQLFEIGGLFIVLRSVLKEATTNIFCVNKRVNLNRKLNLLREPILSD